MHASRAQCFLWGRNRIFKLYSDEFLACRWSENPSVRSCGDISARTLRSVDAAVTCEEVLSSNIGHDNWWFSSVLAGKCRLGYGRFVSNPFQFTIHRSSYHSTPYNLDTGSAAKWRVARTDLTHCNDVTAFKSASVWVRHRFTDGRAVFAKQIFSTTLMYYLLRLQFQSTLASVRACSSVCL